MQGWFTAWLALPIWALFASLFAFYLAAAAILVWLSFRSRLSGTVQSAKGVVAPFFGSVGIIFGLLAAFLSNDIWDRNKLAERVILTESDTLVALHRLALASGSDTPALRGAIRAYASAVVEDEWPRLRQQERRQEPPSFLARPKLQERGHVADARGARLEKALRPEFGEQLGLRHPVDHLEQAIGRSM